MPSRRGWRLLECVAVSQCMAPPFALVTSGPTKQNHFLYRRSNKQFTGPSCGIYFLKLCFWVTDFQWLCYQRRKTFFFQGEVCVTSRVYDDGVVQCNRTFWCTKGPRFSFICVLSDFGPLAPTHSLSHILSEPLGGLCNSCEPEMKCSCSPAAAGGSKK